MWLEWWVERQELWFYDNKVHQRNYHGGFSGIFIVEKIKISGITLGDNYIIRLQVLI